MTEGPLVPSVEHGQNEAERWFERYLFQHGYEYDYEPDLGVEKRPDFLARRGGTEIVCEVKGFERVPALQRRLDGPDRVVVAGPREVYGPMRSAVREAARQLRPLAGTAWPLVVILANPMGHHVQLNGEHLLAAMYGNPGYAGRFDPEVGKVENFEFQHGRDGRLRNDHLYISAVAALHERPLVQEVLERFSSDWRRTQPPRSEPPMPHEIVADAEALHAAWDASEEKANASDGNVYFLEVIRTGSPEAVPLPEGVLNGPRDQFANVERVPVE